ncbi:Uncharacterised protein [Mycobacteroides abscessus subsp. abscessus]|uniref:hypothetical protein n=1 Tax=Mycobacteroides abscessus TaxID=36809 RepID=UPI000928BDC1|nr:hypothetical protein [Mycobacteroides abscessus]SIH19676.1 Uncharacterised protein [Mycobacteroides abscessus subsp. abscessus]
MNDTVGDLKTGELSQTGYGIADAIELWLESRPGLHSPSRIARGVGCGTSDAKAVLEWMERHVYVDAAGNGYWRKYQTRIR